MSAPQLRFDLLTAEELFPPAALPNIDHLVTEDDEPVDNIFSEKQQRLLTESLYNSWQAQRFIALANVGLFYAPTQPPIVPDVLVSLDVKMPDDLWEKPHRSYFIREYLKPPDVVIEIVSNKEGEETGRKLKLYESIGIPYYAIFDPEKHLSNSVLRVFKWHQTGYIETLERWLPKVGLGLRLWEGFYEDKYDTWLRWYVEEDKRKLVLTGAEQTKGAKQEAQEAKQEAQEALLREQAAKQQAQEALLREQAAKQQTQEAKLQEERVRQHNERLVAQLRSLGIDPDKS
jgi:Uma2 family endonuclease